jgi:hypothetical protein
VDENAERVKRPPWINPKKRPARKTQTEEKIAPLRQNYIETINKSLVFGETGFLFFVVPGPERLSF